MGTTSPISDKRKKMLKKPVASDDKRPLSEGR
jgi:hypothetical protein